MRTTKVQPRGQITLPTGVRRQADIRPGDIVIIRVIGPKRLELEVERTMTLEEALERWQSAEPLPEWSRVVHEAEAAQAEAFLEREGPATP